MNLLLGLGHADENNLTGSSVKGTVPSWSLGKLKMPDA